MNAPDSVMNAVDLKAQVDLKTEYVTQWTGARSMLGVHCLCLIKHDEWPYGCCVASTSAADTNKTQGGSEWKKYRNGKQLQAW